MTGGDPDQAARARLIVIATAVAALYMVGVTVLHAAGGHRDALRVALSVAVLATLTHALARTGRLRAAELATAALAGYGALALIALQGLHSARLGGLHVVVVFLGLAARPWMAAGQVVIQLAMLAIASAAGLAFPLSPPTTPVWVDVALQLLLITALMMIFTHSYQRVLAAWIQRTAGLEAAHAELVAASARLERLVGERTIELERASRDLEAFATTISHDLQAPLRHVRQYLALFLEDAAAIGEDRLAPILAARHAAVELTARIEAILAAHHRTSARKT
jgi:signal transduction histidine kinase